MKTFWWFRNDAVAGMARPGFNAAKWLDLDFQQAVILGWIGRFSSSRQPLNSFRAHLREYAPQIFTYHKLNDADGNSLIQPLFTEHGFSDALGKLNENMQILERFSVAADHVEFQLSRKRLEYEVDFLRKNRIETIVTLTEEHHQRDELSSYFETHHISINDLGAPTLDQVMKLKEVLDVTYTNKKRTAIHCLAGIGRTSTMIIGAHMLRGESLETLYAEIKRTNPVFVPSPAQDNFLKEFSKKF